MRDRPKYRKVMVFGTLGLVYVVVIFAAVVILASGRREARERAASQNATEEHSAVAELAATSEVSVDTSGQATAATSSHIVDVIQGTTPTYDDQVVMRDSIPLTHTEWLRAKEDADTIYDYVEDHCRRNNLELTEIEITYFDEEKLVYEVEIYPGRSTTNVKVK